MSLSKKKHQTGFIASVLAVALVLTGTMAWREMEQHKTNKFYMRQVGTTMVLVENFEEETRFKIGEAVNKTISVRNGHADDNIEDYQFENGFVRLQFKEYFETGKDTYVYSDVRYMLDEQGEFIKDADKDALETYMADHDIDDITRIVKDKSVFDETDMYYIKTKAGDKNGQYGKFLVREILNNGYVSIVSGVTNQSESAEQDHHETGPIGEDQYTTKHWDASKLDFAKDSPFTEYVKWTLGSGVIAIDEWDGNPINKWIVDTDPAGDGYVYWGEPLMHSNDITNKYSNTSNFLEKVTLVKQPEGSGMYALHVNMDAVSYSDLGAWTEAPQSIIDAHDQSINIEESRQELLNAINKGKATDTSKMTPETVAVLENAIDKGVVIYDKEKPTVSEMKQAIQEILQAIKDLELDPIWKLSENLKDAIKTGEDPINNSFMTDESVAVLDALVQQGKDILANPDSTKDEIRDITNDILDAFSKLVPDEAKTKAALQKAIDDASAYRLYYFSKPSNKDLLDAKILEAESLRDKPNLVTIIGQVKTMIKQLKDAHITFENDKGVLGDDVYVSNRIYTFVKHNEATDEAIVLSKMLTYQDYVDMGKQGLVNSSGHTMHYQGANNSSVYLGYNNSNIQNIDRAYYDTFVDGSLDEAKVRPVVFEQESSTPPTGYTVTTRIDKPTVVDIDNGELTAFSLSVSDINTTETGNKIKDSHLFSNSYVWLRSPGNRPGNAAAISHIGTIIGHNINNSAGVRPALWVRLP